MFPSEQQFANLLTKQKRKWIYPTKRFDLKNTTYRPDFFLPEENLYIEVVGTPSAFNSNKYKIATFIKQYPKVRFLIVDKENNVLSKPILEKLKKPKTSQTLVIKISSEDYKKIKEMAKAKDREYKQILSYAVNNYWKLVIGNRLST